MASALRSAELNFLLLLRLATYRDDGLLVIGAIVEGIMALRVGHYSTTRPALDEAQVRREDKYVFRQVSLKVRKNHDFASQKMDKALRV
jgi:hypothetical protein